MSAAPVTAAAPGWPVRAVLRRSLARRPRRHYLTILGWSACESIPVLGSGALVGAALDRGFLAGAPLVGVGLLAGYGVLIVVGALAATASLPRMAVVIEDLRADLTRAVVRTAVTGAERGGRLDAGTVDRITNQTDAVRTTLSHLALTLRTLVFSVLFVIVGLIVTAPLVAAATAVSLLLIGLVLLRVSAVWRSRFEHSLVTAEEVTRCASTTFGALRDVIAYGAGHRAARDLEERVDAQNDASVAVGRMSAVRVAVIGIGGRIPLAALLVTAPWLVSSGTMTVGGLVGAAFYLVNGLEPQLRAVVGVVAGLGPQCAVLLRRLVAFGDTVPDRTPSDPAPSSDSGACTNGTGTNGTGTGGRPPSASGTQGERVTLRAVSFAYGPHAEPALDDVDLDVPSGAHLAVVGPSGSGKSTLAGVVAGIVRPGSGGVTIADAPIGSVPRTRLPELVVLVPQEAYVFTGTVRENLAYLNPGVTDAELDDAVSRMESAELVERLGGYGAHLESPASLSEGERQRLTLVRAFVSRSPVLVLDEATCHLHPAAEARIERQFAATGRTLIVVAHRMSSALRADQVAVLDRGRLEGGTHDHLIGSSARYAELVHHWHRR